VSIRDDLVAALPPVTTELIAEFGVSVAAYRPEAKEDQDDNSTSVEWRRVPGQRGNFPVIVYGLTDRQRREVYGLESRARVGGVAPTARGLTTGDILKVLEGSFCPRTLEVVSAESIDEGGVVILGLVETLVCPEAP